MKSFSIYSTNVCLPFAKQIVSCKDQSQMLLRYEDFTKRRGSATGIFVWDIFTFLPCRKTSNQWLIHKNCFFLPPYLCWNSLAHSVEDSSIGVRAVKSHRILNILLSSCLDLVDGGTGVVHSHFSQSLASSKDQVIQGLV